MKTTLRQIRSAAPSNEHWNNFSKSLREAVGEDTDVDAPIEMGVIVESVDLDAALWCLRSIKGIDKECRLFATQCARDVLPWSKSNCRDYLVSIIEVAERFAIGEATEEELQRAQELTDFVQIKSSINESRHLSMAAELTAMAVSLSCSVDAYQSARFSADAARAASASYPDSGVRLAAYAKSTEKQKQKFIEMFC